jgi:cytochrome c556
MTIHDPSKYLSNVGWKGRVKQILILLVVILLGMIISSTLDAQDFHKAQKRHAKAKYRLHTSGQECAILIRKGKSPRKASQFAANYRKPKHKARPEVVARISQHKYKPQAEVDAPKFAMVNP